MTLITIHPIITCARCRLYCLRVRSACIGGIDIARVARGYRSPKCLQIFLRLLRSSRCCGRLSERKPLGTQYGPTSVITTIVNGCYHAAAVGVGNPQVPLRRVTEKTHRSSRTHGSDFVSDGVMCALSVVGLNIDDRVYFTERLLSTFVGNIKKK